MKLPSKKLLGPSLKRWRESKGISAKTIAKKIGVRVNQVHQWERGSVYPKYDRLVEGICPAYEIKDFDHFILMYCCRRARLSDVHHISAKQLNIDFAEFDIERRFAKPRQLGGHPIRIDQVGVPKGKKSIMRSHEGHNYLMVITGKVRFSYAQAKDDKPETITLSAGDAVTYPTTIFHQIEALKEDAQLVVARPPWGKTIYLDERE